ncbi:hypothetical protein OG394_04540 [Kribbella sp. NBC_01245]|uniref:hypothetical protein n=1 Tax=Kribbella sp. NBC_01245 TaxID=2903578 RepID=UPI002E29913F|nr:hypothetical protein [Kribbella sp. NBC_01245]
MTKRHYRVRWWTQIVVAALIAAGAGVADARPAPAPAASLAASPGCGKAPTLTSGTHTIQSNGKSRSFILRLPDNYTNSTQYRLIFGYHWRGGTAGDVDSGGTDGFNWSYYGLRHSASPSASATAAA